MWPNEAMQSKSKREMDGYKLGGVISTVGGDLVGSFIMTAWSGVGGERR